MSKKFRSDYFTYETLKPIIGRPDYISLHHLKKQIKANAQSVSSTLGGGNNGLLGLVLTDAEYAQVSQIAFVREPYPGALVFPNGTTSIQSKMLEDAYRKRMKIMKHVMVLKRLSFSRLLKPSMNHGSNLFATMLLIPSRDRSQLF